jgi:hypothetical protein
MADHRWRRKQVSLDWSLIGRHVGAHTHNDGLISKTLICAKFIFCKDSNGKLDRFPKTNFLPEKSASRTWRDDISPNDKTPNG